MLRNILFIFYTFNTNNRTIVYKSEIYYSSNTISFQRLMTKR